MKGSEEILWQNLGSLRKLEKLDEGKKEQRNN